MLTLDLHQRADCILLCAGGELDVVTSVTFRQRLAELVRQGGHPVVIDLSGLQYLDSCGLGALVLTLRMPEETRPRVVVPLANGSVRRVLRITQIDRLLPIYASVEAALAAPVVQSAA